MGMRKEMSRYGSRLLVAHSRAIRLAGVAGAKQFQACIPFRPRMMRYKPAAAASPPRHESSLLCDSSGFLLPPPAPAPCPLLLFFVFFWPPPTYWGIFFMEI
ncbi:hypothetical protein NL676_027517 [Syzygium grande]|nr:hypothetical protein NL676_027517 [Syzygium grande]